MPLIPSHTDSLDSLTPSTIAWWYVLPFCGGVQPSWCESFRLNKCKTTSLWSLLGDNLQERRRRKGYLYSKRRTNDYFVWFHQARNHGDEHWQDWFSWCPNHGWSLPPYGLDVHECMKPASTDNVASLTIRWNGFLESNWPKLAVSKSWSQDLIFASIFTFWSTGIDNFSMETFAICVQRWMDF